MTAFVLLPAQLKHVSPRLSKPAVWERQNSLKIEQMERSNPFICSLAVFVDVFFRIADSEVPIFNGEQHQKKSACLSF